MFDINSTTFNDIWERYCTANRAQAKKYYNKAKAKAKAQEITKSIKGTTFYIVGGVVTTIKPERELCSIDSLSTSNVFISLIIIVGLLFASFKYISEEDLKTLSGHNLFKGDDICKGL